LGVLRNLGKYIIYNENTEKDIKDKFILRENKEIDCHTAQNAASMDIFHKAQNEDRFEECPVNDEILNNTISSDLDENKWMMKKVYNIPENSDIIYREFNITVHDETLQAFMVFIDGMTDRVVISNNILQPLMLLSNLDIKEEAEDVGDFIYNRLIPFNQIKKAKDYKEVVSDVNFGGCVVFVDGLEYAFAADTKNWEHRGVGPP
jgi:spore germination protein KA